MGHIAGIKNYGGVVISRENGCEDALDGLVELGEDTLLYEPGHKYRYSNYGFRLVGAVVRVAADEPYLDFMQREVFDALGMSRTVPDTAAQMLPEQATQYM